jgi:undecaprenyl diphosphate synthase
MKSVASPSEIVSELKQGTIPHHVAIVMDGNGRWAQSHGKPRVFGHQKGVESVHQVVEIAAKLGVKVLTLYAFSEENWGRPKAEVAALMGLLETYVVEERQKLHEAKVQFRVIGNLERIPDRTRNLILETQELLSQNAGLILNIALSYGSRSEITYACREIAAKVKKSELQIEDISAETISNHLWTKGLADPDLFIRTSGEQRISNFLLWQIAYTELWFSPVYWPDFRKEHFCEAIRTFQSRQRRFGLLPEN